MEKMTKGWTKHHDPTYDHDYYTDETGRSTWTSHDADIARSSPPDQPAANAQQPKVLVFDDDLRPSSAVLMMGKNPMQKASQRSLQSTNAAAKNAGESSSIELRSRTQGGLSGDYEEAILQASSTHTHKHCFSPQRLKLYRNLAISFVILAGCAVGALFLLNKYSMIPWIDYDDDGDLSRAETIERILANCACANDRALYTALLNPGSISLPGQRVVQGTRLTDDIVLHGVNATLVEREGVDLNPVPALTIFGGQLTTIKANLTFDLDLTTLMPVVDASLCGDHYVYLSGSLSADLDLYARRFSSFPLSVEKVDGYATLALRTSPMILVGSGSSFNVSSSSSLCTIDSFTMTGFGSVPSDPTSAVYSVAGNLVDLRLDISTPSELSLLTVSGASVNLGQAFNKVTCLEPPRFLGDIRTLDDEMTAIVSSEAGTILRGSASIVGETAATFFSNETITDFSAKLFVFVGKDCASVAYSQSADPYVRISQTGDFDEIPTADGLTLNGTVRVSETTTLLTIPVSGGVVNPHPISSVSRLVTLPVRGNPVQFQFDDNGDGKVVGDWKIFSSPDDTAPAPAPADELPVEIIYQATDSAPYEVKLLDVGVTLYNDDETTLTLAPEWFKSMTFVSPSTADLDWPFAPGLGNDLFCVESDGTSASAYLIMDQTMLRVPEWVRNLNFSRLQNAELRGSTPDKRWLETKYIVYTKSLRGSDARQCFGANGFGASSMYLVAFGPDPPVETSSFGARSAPVPYPRNAFEIPTTADSLPEYSSFFTLKNGRVKIDWVGEGFPKSISGVTLTGTLLINLGFVETKAPVEIRILTNGRFRFVATDVRVKSLGVALSSVAAASPFFRSTVETTPTLTCELTFSTFDEDLGLTFKSKSFLSMATPINLLLSGFETDVTARVPYLYEKMTNSYVADAAAKITFDLAGSIKKLGTSDGHQLNDVKTTISVRNSIVSFDFDANMFFNFSDATALAAHVAFSSPSFSLVDDSSAASTVSFSGNLIQRYTPKRAPWVTLKTAVISGAIAMTSSSMIITSLQANAVPTLDLDDVDATAVFNFKLPLSWSMVLNLVARSNLTVQRIAEKSLDLPPSAKEFIEASETVDTNIKLVLLSEGEYFHLEADVKCALAPAELLGSANAVLKMSLTATEGKTAAEKDSYFFRLTSEVDRVDFNEYFSLIGVKISAHTDLAAAATAVQILNINIESQAIVSVLSTETTPLKIDSTFSGTHYPQTSRTVISSKGTLHEPWLISESMSLKSGNIDLNAEFKDGRWAFQPVVYKVASQFLLSENTISAVESVSIVADAVGMFDIDSGDYYVLFSGTIGQLGKKLPVLLPTEKGALRSATDISFLEGNFDICVSTSERVVNHVKCINGDNAHVIAVLEPRLLSLLNPFGDDAVAASVGMDINAMYPTGGIPTVHILATFLGQGLHLGPALTLNNVYISSSDFDKQVDYSFDIGVDIMSSLLILNGQGTFAGGAGSSVDVHSKLVKPWFLLPALEVRAGCAAEVKLSDNVEASAGRKWTARSLVFNSCAVVVHAGGSTTTDNRVEATGSGNVDVSSSQYYFLVDFKVVNISDSLSRLLNLNAEETSALVPSTLNDVSVVDSTTGKLTVDSKNDVVTLTFAVKVNAVKELTDPLASFAIPATTVASCSITTSLSSPSWENTNVAFSLGITNFKLGPLVIDQFEMKLDKSSKNVLKVVTTSTFTLLGQQFRMNGAMTQVENSALTATLDATFVPRADYPFLLLYNVVKIQAGSMRINMVRDTAGSDLSVTLAVFTAKVQLKAGMSISDNDAVLTFRDNMENYLLTMSQVNAIRVVDFLPNYPNSELSFVDRSTVDVMFDSKTSTATAKFSGKLSSDLIITPVSPLLPKLEQLSLNAAWSCVATSGVNGAWTVTGEFNLQDFTIGDGFLIKNGKLTAALSSSAEPTWAFDIPSALIAHDTFLAGVGETIDVTLRASYKPNVKTLTFTGSVNKSFHPLGQSAVSIERGSFIVEIEVGSLELLKVESDAVLNTSFTTGDITGRFVSRDNGKKSYVVVKGFAITNLLSVFSGVLSEEPSADAVAKLDPIFKIALTSADVSISNYDSSPDKIPSGFSASADGVLSQTTALYSTLTGLKSDNTHLDYSMRLSIDLVTKTPKMNIVLKGGRGVELFDGVTITGFHFDCAGLKMNQLLAIKLSTILSVELPTMTAPLIAVVEGDFNVALVDGQASIAAGWTASSTVSLAGEMFWNPMGLDIFHLRKPFLEIKFGDNKATPETDVAIDRLLVKASNATLSRIVYMYEPQFTMKSFSPQVFHMNSQLAVKWGTLPHGLSLSVTGDYAETNIESKIGDALLSSRLVEDWWPFGAHDMVVIKKDSNLGFSFKTLLGKVSAMTFKSDVTIAFAGENAVVNMAGSSTNDLNEFCYVISDIPVASIATVMMHVLVEEKYTDAAKKLFLGDGGGVSLEAGVYNPAKPNMLSQISIGSYSKECTTIRPITDVVAGHRVLLDVRVDKSSQLIQLWRLFDHNIESLVLHGELQVPLARSAANPLAFLSTIKTRSGPTAETGIVASDAKLAVNIIDPTSFVVNAIDLDCNLALKFSDGNVLNFNARGQAFEVVPARSPTKYTVKFTGSTRNKWVNPFGLKWLSILSASIDVTTTSDLLWKDTQVALKVAAAFSFEASAKLDVDCLVSGGGSDIILQAALKGTNLQLLSVIGAVGGVDLDQLGKSVYGKYLKESVTQETITFVLSTTNARVFNLFDVLGNGSRKGVSLKVSLLNYARPVGASDATAMSSLVGAFIGASTNLELELWCGVFDVVAGSLPPVELSVRNRGANLVFGGGLITIVDFQTSSAFISATSSLGSVQANATVVFKPSPTDVINVKVGGSPTFFTGSTVGTWSKPLGLSWIDIKDMGLEVRFGKNVGSFFVQDCKFYGTGVIGGAFSGKTSAEFHSDMKNLFFRLSLFYDVSKTPAMLADTIIGKDVVGVRGRRLAEERMLAGEDSCGSGTVVPRSTLSLGAIGKNVTFLQQLLEDCGYLDVKSGDAVGTFGASTKASVLAARNALGLPLSSGGSLPLVDYQFWKALCKRSETTTGIVVGGNREWLSELRFPGWMNNLLFELTYASYEKASVFKKGVTVTGNVNVRERGYLNDALTMMNFVSDYQSGIEKYSPQFQAGFYLPIHDANPTAVQAWIAGGEFNIYAGVVYCKSFRMDVQNGLPPTVDLTANLTVTFSKNAALNVKVWGRVVGRERAILEGKLVGDWKNAFGINGLDLIEAGVSLGVALHQGVDVLTGVSSLHVGVAAQMRLGNTIIYFSGNAGITSNGQPSRELLLLGGLKGVVGGSGGLAVSMRDVAVWWVEQVLGEKGGKKVFGFDTGNIPATWGLYNTNFQLSTASITMFGVTYPPGFALSTGLKIFDMDCNVLMGVIPKVVNGVTIPDFVFQIKNGLATAEALAKKKLVEEVLPAKLIDPSKLTAQERKVKEREGLDFTKPLFVMTGFEIRNINFSDIAQGVRPVVVLKFQFFGVERVMSIETLTFAELGTYDLWGKLNAFFQFTEDLFSVPACFTDGGCYDETQQYCKDICDKTSKAWYGECPKISKTCYIDDNKCLACFGRCVAFKCVF